MRDLLAALRCSRGATAVEYGLIVALIVIVLIAGLRLMAGETVSLWGNVHTAVTNAR